MKDEQFFFLLPMFGFPSTFPELEKVSGDFINSCLIFIIPKMENSQLWGNVGSFVK